jgi:cytoskeletal protein RodZ
MPAFGEKLKGIRESHGATINEISRATKIHPSYLEAVERDDIEVLPGPAYVKFYIRAYADVLGFDPASLIKEYDLELAASEPEEIAEAPPPDHEWKEALRKSREEASAKRVESQQKEEKVEPEPEEAIEEEEEPLLVLPEEPEPERPRYPHRGWRLVAIAVVASVVVSVIVWAYMACSRTDEARVDAPAESVAQEESAPQQPAEQPVESPPQEIEEEQPQIPPGPLSVTEYAVGRRLVGHIVEGLDDSFEEGEVVWFSTRVRGGEPGDVIRHYWFRDGGRVQIVDLELGSSHYRTRSKKTLWGVGEWTVEARDPEGRVLARAGFTCVPR